MADDSQARLREEWEADTKNLTKIFEKADKGKQYKGEEPFDTLAGYHTGVSTTVTMSIGLAGGGPGTRIDATVSLWEGVWEVDDVWYRGSWGSAEFERRIAEGSALYRYAEWVLESTDIAEQILHR